MAAPTPSDIASPGTTTERISARELVVTRLVRGPARLVYAAWTTPELFRQWWAPSSFGVSIVSYDAEIRTGGSYRLVMNHPSLPQPMAFFGKYIEVTPSRLVWTNEEGGEAGAVTTVTFEDRGETTLVVVHERYPSEQALDDAISSGSTSGWPEQFAQLDQLLGDQPQD